MDKMALDTLVRRYTIHHKDKNFMEIKSTKKKVEDYLKDEVVLEKIVKFYEKELNSISIIYGIEISQQLDAKKKKIAGITRELDVFQHALENLRTEKTELLNKQSTLNRLSFKWYEKDYKQKIQENEKQIEIDNHYLDLLENLKA